MNPGNTTIYANIVAIMLDVGMIALARKLKMKDEMEKKIFLSLVFLVIMASVGYLLCEYRDRGVLEVNNTGAILIETYLETMLSLFSFQWFLYVDYRIFHSIGHLKRDLKFFVAPFFVTMVLIVINIFTGILIWFDEDMVYHETPVYVVIDLIRLLYFIGSLAFLEYHKRNDKRMRFFSVKSFFIPLLFYVLLYYFTPYATVTLGLSIGLALIYVQIVNALCYQDMETGFFNRFYLKTLTEEIQNGEYELNSALVYVLPEGDTEYMANLISAQLPQECDTIRYSKDAIITLADVKDRAPLHMLSEDIEMSFEEEKIPISVSYSLRKKKESGVEFLNRFLESM